MEEKFFFGRATSFIKNSASVKIAVIVMITLLLLIPVSMVKSLIMERGDRQNEVIREISGKWGGPQTIGGPVLTVPYRKIVHEQQGQPPVVTNGYAHFLPDSLIIKGSMEPELLYRGIYEALLYRAELQISGNFSFPDMNRLDLEAANILWDKAFISIGITDMGGIRSRIEGTMASEKIEFEPGIESSDVFASGVSSPVVLNQQGKSMDFSFTMGVNGNSHFHFLPLGKQTRVSMASNWPAPSFTGNFLPDQRRIDSSGFSAQWNVLHLSRNLSQSWLGFQKDISNSSFGVSLHSGTDVYQKTTRTAKYGVMFILFTFTAFFLAEIIHGRRMHPIQYLLVGVAVIIFYVLLLALSEHVGFNSAFCISALAVVGLIGGYTRSIVGRKMAIVVSCILSILYGYLFITLQQEDYALLVGSIGLFMTLAAVMYLTRSIDWYFVSSGNQVERRIA